MIPDHVQSHDRRGIPLDAVGGSGQHYLLLVSDHTHAKQDPTPEISMSIDLPAVASADTPAAVAAVHDGRIHNHAAVARTRRRADDGFGRDRGGPR